MVNQRIRDLRKSLKMTQDTFATKIGAKQSNIADWERGRSAPSLEAMNRMVAEWNINLHWLLTGEGQIYLPAISTPSVQQELKQKVFNFIRNELSILERDETLLPPSADDFWYLPISGEIAAGNPMEFNTDTAPIHRVAIDKMQLHDPDNCDVLRVNGDSMEPKIEHGDLVVIKRTEDWMSFNNKVVAVRTGDGLTLKQLKLDPEKQIACLMPFNRKYDPIYLDEDSVICGYLLLLIRQC